MIVDRADLVYTNKYYMNFNGSVRRKSRTTLGADVFFNLERDLPPAIICTY